MRNKLTILSLLLMMTACRCSLDSDKVICHPEQVHLSYGDKLSEMIVIWSTKGQCSAEVHYGVGPWDSSNVVEGTTIAMVYKNPLITSFLHRVKLTNLNEDTTYYYMPISNTVSSGPFYFKTPKTSQDWQPEFLVYGDLGVHSEGLTNLQLEAMTGRYSAVFHIGDFGYNLYETINAGMYKDQNVGDVFMGQIEEIASHVPYMVSPGNHEIEDGTFNQYRYRFSMPNSDWPIPLQKMWYSFDIGPIHFLSYSTEVFFFANKQYVNSQRQWILADLEAANNNRHSRPWIVALGHRPMYCSNNDTDDCTKLESEVRLGLEDIFYRQGVDIVLQAHEHSYERLWPMYKGVVLSFNYTNPGAPVQLISGAAGSKHGIDEMNPTLNETWSAFRMDNKSFNSYGRLKAYNSTHMFWEQVAVLTGEVLDSIWIVQDSHGPFTQTSLPEDQKDKINKQKAKDDVIIGENLPPKPETTGDTLTEKVSKAIKGADIKLIVGVSFGVFVVLFLILVCVIRRCCCKRRSKSYRRWETLDYGKKFYTNLKNEEKDGDDFEVEVTDGTTKLINDDKD